MIAPRVSVGLLAAMLFAVGCGGDGPSAPPPVPPAVGSIRILSGHGQVDTAGAFVPVVIEVLDVNGEPSPGHTLVLTSAGSEPPIQLESGDEIQTDALGHVELRWQIYGRTGFRHLIAAVLGSARVGKDSIVATVLPASPSSVQYAEATVSRLLNQPADLAANIVSIMDTWGNPVTIRTVSVEAPPPLSVSGQATVVSHVEVDTVVALRINDVVFLQRVVVLRAVRDFLGAVGDWTCSSSPGAPWVETPGDSWDGRFLQTEVGHFVVDSISRYGDYGSAWTFHVTTTLRQTLDGGETRQVGPYYERRYLQYQFAGGFLMPYGPEMRQTGNSPVTYVAHRPECFSWGGSAVHVPLTLILSD